MCQLCGDPRCGKVDLYKQAAAPVTAAVVALKAAGYEAVGVMADDAVVTGEPTMAHDAMTAREVMDKRDADKERLKAAHERQHGLAKANDNLNLPDEVETDAEGNVVKAKTKAQRPAEDK